MILTLSPDSVNFSNFEFVRDNSSISFNGTTYSDQSQNFDILIKNLTGDVLSKYFLDIDDDYIESSFNLDGSIKGKFAEPEMDFNLTMNNLSYNNVKLGNIICNAKYSDKNVLANLVLLTQHIILINRFLF